MRGTRSTGAAHRETRKGGSRHFRSQLNHADPARLVEQPSERAAGWGFESLDPYEIPLNPARGTRWIRGSLSEGPGRGGTDNSTEGTLAVRCGTPANDRSPRHCHAPRTIPGVSGRQPRKPARAGTTFPSRDGVRPGSMRAGPKVGQRPVKPSLRHAGFDPLARNHVPVLQRSGDRAFNPATGVRLPVGIPLAVQDGPVRPLSGTLAVRFRAEAQAPIAQRIERLPPTEKVPGSIPGRCATPRSANGQATWFSARQSEFDSPSGYVMGDPADWRRHPARNGTARKGVGVRLPHPPLGSEQIA